MPPQVPQDADHIGRQEMSSDRPDFALSVGPTQISRKCGPCEEEEQKSKPKSASVPDQLMRMEGGGQPSVTASAPRLSPPSIVHHALGSGGQPLDAGARAFFESRMGHDFSRVRIHTGSTAAESADAVGALAYTVGPDIVFGAGRYAPSTTDGRALLAHELVHTMQQRSATGTNLRISAPDDASERQADLVAGQVLAGQSSASGPSSSRIPYVAATEPVLARYDCSKLTYKTCTTGVYKCGYGGSGTCGWVGPSRGGCICVGADKPSTSAIALALLALGLSIALVLTVAAALLDPEPASKLALAGLTAAEASALLVMLGFKDADESGPTASADGSTGSSAVAAADNSAAAAGGSPSGPTPAVPPDDAAAAA